MANLLLSTIVNYKHVEFFVSKAEVRGNCWYRLNIEIIHGAPMLELGAAQRARWKDRERASVRGGSIVNVVARETEGEEGILQDGGLRG